MTAYCRWRGGEYLRNSDWLAYQSYNPGEGEICIIYKLNLHTAWHMAPKFRFMGHYYITAQEPHNIHGLLWCVCVYNLDTFSDVKNVFRVCWRWRWRARCTAAIDGICILNEARSSNVNTSAQERIKKRESRGESYSIVQRKMAHPLFLDFFFFFRPRFWSWFIIPPNGCVTFSRRQVGGGKKCESN